MVFVCLLCILACPPSNINISLLVFSRGQCSAAVRCLGVPPRERPEIYLCHAGRPLLSSLFLPPFLFFFSLCFSHHGSKILMKTGRYVLLIFSYPTIVVVSISWSSYLSHCVAKWLHLIKLLWPSASNPAVINHIGL